MKAIRQHVLFWQSLPQLNNPQFLGTALLLLVTFMLTGCGEDAFVCDSASCATSSSTSTGGTTTGTGGSTTTGVTMNMSMSPTTLATGDTASVTVRIQNADSSAYANNVIVSLTTTCGSSTIPTNATVTSGIATVSYIAGSCTGSDTITASAIVDTEPLTATAIATITAPTINVLMGRGYDVTFEQGLLLTGTGAASDGQAALSAGGSTSIQATLVDGDLANALYATPTSISFSSTCVAAGNATMTSPIVTTGGTATTTYIATGCSGDDTITASATIGTTVLRAQQTITVAAATVGSVQFVSADPSIIAIAGTGGGGLQETSTLTFKVVDSLGGGVSGQIVNFALNTNVGGIQLSAVSGVTQADGTVQVTVQSGTIPTPVNVTATTTDLASSIDYSTQSDALVISTGRADEDSFSISIETFNPEAYDIDGVNVNITIRAADHFNNPVPDGTAISFRTEGGSIQSSCQTMGGACSVVWTSQDPRPSDGRVTILAYANGNESYTDANGNGVYDDFGPAGFFDTRGADLAEAWLDSNEDGIFQNGVEEFVDFNLDGTYTAADGAFTGVLCQHSTDCAPTTSLHVREDVVLVMSRSQNDIGLSANSSQAGPPPIICIDSSTFTSVNITVDGARTAAEILAGVPDGNQYPPMGTTIAVSTDIGSISGTSNWTVANGIPPAGATWSRSILLTGSGSPGIGTLTVTVQTPAGVPDELIYQVQEFADKSISCP